MHPKIMATRRAEAERRLVQSLEALGSQSKLNDDLMSQLKPRSAHDSDLRALFLLEGAAAIAAELAVESKALKRTDVYPGGFEVNEFIAPDVVDATFVEEQPASKPPAEKSKRTSTTKARSKKK